MIKQGVILSLGVSTVGAVLILLSTVLKVGLFVAALLTFIVFVGV